MKNRLSTSLNKKNQSKLTIHSYIHKKLHVTYKNVFKRKFQTNLVTNNAKSHV